MFEMILPEITLEKMREWVRGKSRCFTHYYPAVRNLTWMTPCEVHKWKFGKQVLF